MRSDSQVKWVIGEIDYDDTVYEITSNNVIIVISKQAFVPHNRSYDEYI